ncbi:MAG: hypothetical protein ABIU77_19305 [Ferruginibacter sp.]
MKIILFCLTVLSALFFCACGKPAPAATPPGTASCLPLTESTNFNAAYTTYTYSYNADGTLANISYPPVNLAIGYSSTSITQPATVRAGLTDSLNTYYNANIFTGLPTTASQWITMDGITQSDYWNYTFAYDGKSRLVQVMETTPHIATDWEYKLTIFYNEKDNVTSLKYESITGPNASTVITATGYDDKPSPYSGIKNWQLYMHAGWNNYDPGPIFEALSKNNLLGFNNSGDPDRIRTITYTYNDNGFPLTRTNTNKKLSDGSTYSYTETYTYQCK